MTSNMENLGEKAGEHFRGNKTGNKVAGLEKQAGTEGTQSGATATADASRLMISV